jgi:hypothetical protein
MRDQVGMSRLETGGTRSRPARSLSQTTVKKPVQNAYGKLGFSHRRQDVARARTEPTVAAVPLSPFRFLKIRPRNTPL